MNQSFIKRCTGLAMAVVTLVTFTPMPVAAKIPDPVPIFFKFPAISADTRSGGVIVGNSIDFGMKRPGNYRLTANPFAVTAGAGGNGASITNGGTTDNDRFFTAGAGSAQDTAVGGNGREDYRIVGSFYALQAEGTAIESWPATRVTNPTPPGGGPPKDYVLDPAGTIPTDVVCISQEAIQEPSTLTLTCIDGQTTETDNAVQFEKSGGTGAFGGTSTAGAVTATIKREGSIKYIEVTLNGTKPITMKLYPKQQHYEQDGSGNFDPNNGKPILKPQMNSLVQVGTTYQIDFQLPTTETLMLTVVTPTYVVNAVKDAIGTTGADYIKPAGTDNVNWITKDFTVLTKKVTEFHKQNDPNDYNVIEWQWIPDAVQADKPPTWPTDDFMNVIKVLASSTQGNNAPVEVIQRDFNVTGVMQATVKYKGKLDATASEAVAVVPIVVRGKGKPPFVELVNKTIGQDAPIPINSTNIQMTPTSMDVYDGGIIGYPVKPTDPYKFNAVINMGGGNAACTRMKIDSTDKEAVSVYVKDSVLPYTFGSYIDNTLPSDGLRNPIEVRAKTGGRTTKLTFTFYTLDAAGKEAVSMVITTPTIAVADTTPSDDATLKSLSLAGFTPSPDNSPLDYVINIPGFSPDTDQRSFEISVPYQAASVKVSAGANEIHASVKVIDGTTEYPLGNSGTTANAITLEVLQTKVIKVEVQAQDTSTQPQTYSLRITRQSKEANSKLKDLRIFSPEKPTDNLLTTFNPNTLSYDLSVRYGVKRVRVEAEPESRWASKVEFLPPPMPSVFYFETQKWISLGHLNDPLNQTNPTQITTTVTAEDGVSKSIYRVNVTRMDPSENNKLSKLSVLNQRQVEIPFRDEQGNEGLAFNGTRNDYYIRLPYSTQEIRFKATPEDEYVTQLTLLQNGNPVETIAYQPGREVSFTPVKIPVTDDKFKDIFTYSVYATAESGKPATASEASLLPYLLYTVEFTRDPPNSDVRLESLIIKDQKDVNVDTFTFNEEQLEYNIKVPYGTEQVKVFPKAKSPLSLVTVNEQEITENRPYLQVPLTAGKAETITVEVTAENGDKRKYVVVITRELASTEARLQSLVITGGTNFRPLFIPSNTNYSVTIPEKTKGYTVTAVPVDPFATMQINEKKADSGVAFGPIIPVEATSRLEIIVTAQDGKTKKTYTVTVTDENLIVKSSNADLASLKVNYGEMSPAFKPSVWDYEVYAKDDTASVDLIPRPANAYATMEVKAGSKVLGDYNNNYSSAITDDANEFTIKVTAQDKVTTREYKVIVYRNDEEKKGVLKPITVDMVNYEQESPIVVDISKYFMVEAEVINEMQKYPDKTMLFQGNDYSLEFNGADLKTLVPNTEVFDFSLSFTSPFEDEIWDVLDRRDANDNLKPVFVHFNHHGALPAPMKFTLSLGRKYKNDTLHWNYYNQERDRIDYYGAVETNAKGTFAVQLTHMSTYFVTTKVVAGAENKVGMGIGGAENLNEVVHKYNPGTGVKAGAGE